LTVLALDVESTTKNKGHPFTKSNRLCLVGLGDAVFKIEYDDAPYGQHLAEIQNLIDSASVIVGFNLKFDIHWLRRYGISFENVKKVWDVQLAYFAMCGQTKSYPELDVVAAEYGLGQKLDVVKTEYWENGIDTPDIPLDILVPYLQQDVNLTLACYNHQQELLKDQPKLRTLIRMTNLDLLVLEDMEFNGLHIDLEQAKIQADECSTRVKEIDAKLNDLVQFSHANWNSGYHCSAVLFGGSIKYIVRELKQTTLKTGKVSERIRKVEYVKTFDRLVEPSEGSELAKSGFWSVSEDNLNALRCHNPKARAIVDLILERHEIAKLGDTYFTGIPKLITELEWEDNCIHGNLNQCVAVTGRLSSTKPNMQNMPAIVDKLFRSRYVTQE
jgi:DNA polymerase-1